MQIFPLSSRLDGLSLFAAITLLFVSHTSGIDIVVQNTSDSGPGSLRQAIIDNNASGGLNTIVFSNVNGSITLTSGELLITKYVTILGPGPRTLAVDGNATSRVFHLSTSNNAVDVFIAGLTITNGAVSGTFPGRVGGGIWNDHGTLTLSNCAIMSNHGSNGPGGAIYNDGGSPATVSDTANLWIIASTVSGNSASNHGGAIFNYGNKGRAFITIVGSTISGNTANGASTVGGAVFNNGNQGLAALGVSASTFSGNSAGEFGGAIYNTGAASGNGLLSLIGSTFSGNSASNSAGGGGIFNNGAGGAASLVIIDTILKTGASGANLVNNGGTVVSHGYNLSSDNGAGLLTHATDRINIDPLLGPLGDNGGPTLTHALLPGSPAIDKGSSFGVTTDQRGEPRPFDFASVPNAAGGDGSDIGAFEVGRPTLNIQQVGNSAVLSWPSNYGDFTLQSSTNVTSSNSWMSADGSAVVVGNQYQQTNGPISASRFFRLRRN
jgi:predicted outer membrane repeat protein